MGEIKAAIRAICVSWFKHPNAQLGEPNHIWAKFFLIFSHCLQSRYKELDKNLLFPNASNMFVKMAALRLNLGKKPAFSCNSTGKSS
jgi:hypothetical protein